MDEPESQPVSTPVNTPVSESDTDTPPRIRKMLAGVHVSDWIASLAALTAVVSLVIAVLGYRLAKEQTSLSRDQFEQSRSFWWLCSVDDNLTLTLIPSRNDAVVESTLIVFPKSLFRKGEDWGVKPKNLQVSLHDIYVRLMAARKSEVTFDKATGRFNVHAVPHLLPLIVESRYIVGGTMHSDRTIFFVRVRTKWSLGPKGVDNVKLESLALSDPFLYGKLVDESDDTDATLSKYWDVSAGHVIAQVAPIGGAITMEGPFHPRFGSDSKGETAAK